MTIRNPDMVTAAEFISIALTIFDDNEEEGPGCDRKLWNFVFSTWQAEVESGEPVMPLEEVEKLFNIYVEADATNFDKLRLFLI